MADRILRSRALSSESLDKLTPSAEVLFYRLLLVGDDFGRFEADVRLLLAKCYPLKVGDKKLSDVASDFDDLERAGIVGRYVHDGRTYGYFTNWKKYNTPRAKASKFPDPDSCERLQTSANTCKQIPPDSDSDSDSDSKADLRARDPRDVDNSPSTSDGRPESGALPSRRRSGGIPIPEPIRKRPGGHGGAPAATSFPAIPDDQAERIDRFRRRIQGTFPRQSVAIDRMAMRYVATGSPPEALGDALESLLTHHRDDHPIEDPEAYLSKILRVEGPNACARRHEAESKGLGLSRADAAGVLKRLAEQGGAA